MEFTTLCETRRSIHHFVKGEISDAQISEMVRLAGLSPSGYNAQPWEFLFFRNEENIRDLHKICLNQDQVLEASAMCIVIGDKNIVDDPDRLVQEWVDYGHINEEYARHWKPKMRMERPDWKVREMVVRNVSLAAMTLMYAAHDMGIATCPMMGVRQLDLRSYLKLPEDKMPVLVIAMGYEDTSRTKKRLPRKDPKSLVHFEEYGKKGNS